jgi:hypothetical protein
VLRLSTADFKGAQVPHTQIDSMLALDWCCQVIMPTIVELLKKLKGLKTKQL